MQSQIMAEISLSTPWAKSLSITHSVLIHKQYFEAQVQQDRVYFSVAPSQYIKFSIQRLRPDHELECRLSGPEDVTCTYKMAPHNWPSHTTQYRVQWNKLLCRSSGPWWADSLSSCSSLCRMWESANKNQMKYLTKPTRNKLATFTFSETGAFIGQLNTTFIFP